MSETTRTGSPVGSVSSTLSPPTLSGSFVAVRPVASASRSTSAESAARNAGPTNRDAALADQHARRTRVGTPQLQLVRRCVARC